MTTIIAHVRHRVADVHRRQGQPQMGHTNCGIKFLRTFEYLREPDRLAHEPARVRCATCYAW